MEKIRIIVMPAPSGAVGRVCVYSDKKYDEFIDRSRNENINFRFDESLSRTKFLRRELSLCNPWDYFCTFTFDSDKVDRYDYPSVSSKLRKFFNNYRNRYSSNFRYMVVPESHVNGGIHFHGLLKGVRVHDLYVPDTILKRVEINDYNSAYATELIEVPNTPGYMRWRNYRFGFMDISPVQDHFRCSSYILKYITKQMQHSDFLNKGDRILLASSGLRRSLEVCKEDIDYSYMYSLVTHYFGEPMKYDFCDVYQDIPMDKIDEVLQLL